MNTALKTALAIMIGFAVTVSTACTQKEVEFFHGGYPVFEPGPPGGAALVEIRENIDFKKYKTIIMDSVYFRFDSAAQYNAIPPHVLEELREAFDNAFIDALRGAYPLVKQPRPDAMRIRVAILNVIPLVKDSTISDVPVSMGGATIKAEILDSMTNERIAAVIDSKTGYKSKSVKSNDEWEHTRDVFKYWAQRLRNWLDEPHGRR